jgi:energy-coupling factor transport system substrate-specific component
VTRKLLSRAQALPQPTRFLLAGGLAAGVNWLARIPLSAFMPFVPAVLVAACVGMLVGFIMYRGFVFPYSPRPMLLQLRDFLVVNIVTSVLVAISAALILGVLIIWMSSAFAEAAAHGIAICLGALLNYFGHSVFTFSRRTVRDARVLPHA